MNKLVNNFVSRRNVLFAADDCKLIVLLCAIAAFFFDSKQLRLKFGQENDFDSLRNNFIVISVERLRRF